MFGAEPLTLSIIDMRLRFASDAVQFFKDFGVVALQGVAAWLMMAPVIFVLVYFIVFRVMSKFISPLEKGIKGFGFFKNLDAGFGRPSLK